MVGLLVLTHLLIPSAKGPVKGQGGRRFAIACDQQRAYLATATNQEAVTDQAGIANCPGCLKVAKELKITPRDQFGHQMVLTEKETQNPTK